MQHLCTGIMIVVTFRINKGKPESLGHSEYDIISYELNSER